MASPKPPPQPRKKRDKKRKSHNSRANQRNWMERLDAWHQVDAVDWGTPIDSAYQPTPATVKVYEHQSRVDRLHDIVPFWRDGVLAAEAGEELGKWEEFYKKLDERPAVDDCDWPMPNDDPWGWNMEPKKDGEDPASWGAPAPDDPWSTPAPAWGWGEPVAEPADPQPAVGWGDPSPLRSRASSVKPISQPKSNHFDNWDAWSKQSRKKHRQKNNGVDRRDLRSFVDKLAHDEHTTPERKQLLNQFYTVSSLVNTSLESLS